MSLAPPERRDPYLRAYQCLRHDLVSGTRQPGDQIIVTQAARLLAISPTPVREALARLVGERLVDDRRHHGYFVPLPSWFDLLELYELCEMYLVSALRSVERRQQSAGRAKADAEDSANPAVLSTLPDDPFARLHYAILSRAPNAKLTATGCLVVDALAAARRMEAEIFPGPDLVVARLDLLADADAKPLLSAVRLEFRLRRHRAEPVAYALAARHRAKNRPDMV